MSKYTLIVSELKTVNEARFQLICNHYLAREHNAEVKSPGTVVGKEKTRKGKPDAYIRFDDGSYLLAEYTTKEKDENPEAFFKKLEGDLQDCLNFEALHINPEQVRQIVLCCNSGMTPAEEELLHQIAKPYSLRFVDVHALGIFLHLKGKTIAREFLDIPFDTNQLLTKTEFLDQYHKRNLSTRLDTLIVGRETEQAEIIKAITNQEITIVKGPAGVGKSRLVLAAIDAFCKGHPSFEPMYVQSKNESITEDLVYNLESDKSYLLFVDDANRQMDNFLRIIYKQTELSAENIKVVLTVRDYAFEEIRRKLSELRFATFEIRRLSDEVIREILLRNNYVFEDTVLLNRIISISKGNPRLALMAASFSIERTDLNLLADVSTIYDAYFQTIIQDKEVFRDPTTLKVLGILSYFYALDLETAEAKQILQAFDIAYDVFIETANLLHDLELVDIYQTYTVKITEQVLSTYFFYKVFIKERLLSFENLLQSFFRRYAHRMKDSFYPAVNSFGSANTVAPLKETLLRFYETAKNNDREESLFLGVFGPFLPLQVFAAVQKTIAQLPASQPIKETKSATLTSLQFYPPLQFLEPFYGSKEPFELQTALELTMQYVTKRPGLYDATRKALLEKLRTTEEDLPSCERQRVAFEWLRQQSEPLAKKYFFSLFAEIFLTIFFPDEAYYNTGDDWDLHGSVKEIRGSFWQEVRHSIHDHQELCFPILWEYLKDISRGNATLLDFDSPFLKAITEELDPSRFEDALFVHRYIETIQARGIKLDWHRKAKKRFNNSSYRVFTALSFEREERIALRKIYNDYDKFNAYKIRKISKTLLVSTLRAFKEIYPLLQEVYDFSKQNRYQVNPEIDLLVAGIISKHPVEGIKVLRYYFQQGNRRSLNPVLIYKQALTAGVEWVHKIYQLAKKVVFPHQEDWLEFYFAILPVNECTKAKLNELLSFYRTTPKPIHWKNIVLAKFIGIEPDLPTILLRLLTTKRSADPAFKYDLGYEFFMQYPQVIEKDFEVSKQAYFQHLQMEGDYDYEKKEFALFFKKDPKFLLDYIQEKNKSKGDLSDRSFVGLEKIWDMGEVGPAVYEALLYLINLKTYYSSDHVGLIFFHNLPEPHVSRAIALLKKMIDDFPADNRVIDTVLDIGRNAFPKHYHDLIVYYLKRNPHFELFKKIHFYNNHFSSSGNVSWDEFKANVLKGISATIQQMPKAYLYTEHLAFLDRYIVAYIRNSEEERKRWFMGMS